MNLVPAGAVHSSAVFPLCHDAYSSDTHWLGAIHLWMGFGLAGLIVPVRVTQGKAASEPLQAHLGRGPYFSTTSWLRLHQSSIVGQNGL